MLFKIGAGRLGIAGEVPATELLEIHAGQDAQTSRLCHFNSHPGLQCLRTHTGPTAVIQCGVKSSVEQECESLKVASSLIYSNCPRFKQHAFK